jgi:hypothetical protein
MKHNRKHYQQGSLTIEKRKNGERLWVYRWREQCADGGEIRRKHIVGPKSQPPIPETSSPKRALSFSVFQGSGQSLYTEEVNIGGRQVRDSDACREDALTTKEPGDVTISNDTVTVINPSGAPEPIPIPVKDLDFVVDKLTYDKEMVGEPGIWYGWQGAQSLGRQYRRVDDNWPELQGWHQSIPPIPRHPHRA